MTTKVNVTHTDIHAPFDVIPTENKIWIWLKAAFPYPGDIEWNFSKFVLDWNGAPIRRFKPSLDDLVETEALIVALLNQRDRLLNGLSPQILPVNANYTA